MAPKGNFTVARFIDVISTKFDGSPRDAWPAQLNRLDGTQLTLYIPSGTEEIVKGRYRQTMPDGFTALFWTDRWYNIWLLDQTNPLICYINIAMPCQFDGKTLRWIDLDIDIEVYRDGSAVVRDQDEFDDHRKSMGYSAEVINQALAARDLLLEQALWTQFSNPTS